MIAEISALLFSTANATKALSGLRDITQDSKAREKILEAQGVIADLQAKVIDVNAKYAELLESKNAIQTKLKEYENWDTKAANYELKKLATGSFVQTLKADAPTGEPAHYACPKCFEKHKRSVLQGIDEETLLYRCPECSFETNPSDPGIYVGPTVNFPGHR